MSGDVTPNACPKCGYPTRNPEVCEACGALLSRIRGRDYLNAVADEDETDYPYSEIATAPPAELEPDQARTPWLTYTAVALAVAGAGAGYYLLSGQRTLEQTSTETPAESSPAMAANVPEEEFERPEPIAERREAVPASSSVADVPVVPIEVPQHPPTGGKIAEDAEPVLTWLESLKNTALTPSSSGLASATPLPSPTPQMATDSGSQPGREQPTTRSGNSEIEIGEEMFSSSGNSPGAKAISILEQLESRKAVKGQQPAAAPATATPQVTRSRVLEVNDDTYLAEVGMYAEKPVLAGFWDPAHPTAEVVQKILAGMEESYGDQLKVVAIDVNAAKSTVSRVGVSAVPAMVMFKRGREVARAANPLSPPDIHLFVASQLAGP